MIDIFEYAREYNADYYDITSGKIYHVQEYNEAKKNGLPLPVPGIKVTQDGVYAGYVPDPNLFKTE